MIDELKAYKGIENIMDKFIEDHYHSKYVTGKVITSDELIKLKYAILSEIMEFYPANKYIPKSK